MAEFKVGDRVVRKTLSDGKTLDLFGVVLVGGEIYTVSGVDNSDCVQYISLAEKSRAGQEWSAPNFSLYVAPVEALLARANDPATSKAKRKVNKYEEGVIAQLTLIGSGTGKEIAALSKMPLNCITPRFAPLRRKGLIKDSGQRRDKQIVWVLA